MLSSYIFLGIPPTGSPPTFNSTAWAFLVAGHLAIKSSKYSIAGFVALYWRIAKPTLAMSSPLGKIHTYPPGAHDPK